MANRFVHVTCNECHVRNIVGCQTLFFWKLCTRKDVVTINVTLKQDLTTCVKIKDAAVHTSDIEREQAAPVREGAGEVLRLRCK